MILPWEGPRDPRKEEFLLVARPFRVVLGGRVRSQWPGSPHETDAILWLAGRTPSKGT
ncbi:hypothetical protein GCM10022403_002030 [Streptomyces coacervatus]|uniref:Uncharacterized protein n=1 Tax=Streptomyces coacervatus TaxID=647381 RepID=A0ABP7GTL6_9ACTN